MKKHIILVALLAIVVMFASSSAFAAASNTFTFNESYQNQESCFPLWGTTFCDTTVDTGKFTIKAKLLLNGFDISQFNKETLFGIGIGAFSFDGYLGDDWTYVPGKTSVKISYVQTDEETGRPVRYLTWQMSWNTKQLNVTLSGVTPDYVDPIMADMYVDENTIVDEYVGAGIDFCNDSGSDCSDLLYVPFNVHVTGKASLKTKISKGITGISINTSKVTIKGK